MNKDKATTMDCQAVETLMGAVVFGDADLRAEDLRRFDAHVNACPACRQAFDAMRAAAGLVGDAMCSGPAPRMSTARREAVMDAIQRESRRVLVLRIPMRPLALAASVGAVGLIVWVVMLSTGGPDEGAVQLALHTPEKNAADIDAGKEAPMSGAFAPGAAGADDAMPADVTTNELAPGRGGWASNLVTGKASSKLADAPRRMESRDAAIAPAESAAAPASAPDPRPASQRGARALSATQENLNAIAADAVTGQGKPQTPLPPARLFRQAITNVAVPTEQQRAQAIAVVADSASFEITQQYLDAGFLPPAGAVRTEDFVNSVNFNTLPLDRLENRASAVDVRAILGPAPFHEGLSLLKIDLLAAEKGTRDETASVAENVRLRVEFDPQRVRQHRLVGYEDHLLGENGEARDVGDVGGQLGSGQVATVLYEIELDGKVPIDRPAALGVMSVRYRDPADGEEVAFQRPLMPARLTDAAPASAPEFYLSAVAAAFAERLRGQGTDLDAIAALLERVRGRLPDQSRADELLAMVRAAQRAVPAP